MVHARIDFLARSTAVAGSDTLLWALLISLRAFVTVTAYILLCVFPLKDLWYSPLMCMKVGFAWICHSTFLECMLQQMQGKYDASVFAFYSKYHVKKLHSAIFSWRSKVSVVWFITFTRKYWTEWDYTI